MRHIILLAAVLFTATITDAQTKSLSKPTSYEAATWSTWLLDNPRQYTLSSPPVSDRAKKELQVVKQEMSNVDAKKLEEIRYWDAGAPAYRWNQLANKLLAGKFDVILRTPAAWMNIAIYDATILAWKEKIKYKRSRPGSIDLSIKPLIAAPGTYSYPCEHAVTAAAAANLLAYFLPDKADSIIQLGHLAAQSRVNAGVEFPSDIEAGWKLGEMVAKEIIEKARNDGSAKKWDGQMNKDPKKWTGPYPMGITLALFTPIVIRSADQFRPAAPPDFSNDMKELKKFKPTFTSTSLAYFWANNGPELWSDLASRKMFEYRMSDDAPAVARIYTVLNTAFHDATIAIMDAKYTYWGIRPNQLDTTYRSLIPTPPFPGYPSGHAMGAGTTSAVLEYFFPADAKEFQKLAQDCADSRFYAGIHFRTDNETGLQLGRELGKYVVETWMKK